ncbi:hypothetical protein HDU78_005293 [Chytriomyces hyalinus]|nr:hypothetical protein HDU78_005293 [Chytriomyces hyalinus]
MSVQQGMELMNQAAKYMDKKTWLGKPNPDLDSARPLYEQAALQFKNAKATDYAVDAHCKVAEIYRKQDALYLSAKQIEAAALILEKDKKPIDAAKLFKQASDQFVMYGSGEKGAEVLEKAARGLEAVNFDEALFYYSESCALYDVEDKPRSGIDTYGRFISFLVRNRRWPQAIETSERLLALNRKLDMRINFNKQALTTVIIVLLSGDSVEARKRLISYEEYPGFYDSQEGQISSELIECFENYDDVRLAEILKNATIRYLDNEIAKASQTLRIPGSGGGARTAAAPIQTFTPQIQQQFAPRPPTNQQPQGNGYISPTSSQHQISPREPVNYMSSARSGSLRGPGGEQQPFLADDAFYPNAASAPVVNPAVADAGYRPSPPRSQPQSRANLVDDDDDLC